MDVFFFFQAEDGIRDIGVTGVQTCALPISLLNYPTLALKLFRGEPAISEFDWNFSAIHSSSHGFSTPTWFGPPRNFTSASSWPWIGHPVSGLQYTTRDRKSTRLNSSHANISYAVFCLKKTISHTP